MALDTQGYSQSHRGDLIFTYSISGRPECFRLTSDISRTQLPTGQLPFVMVAKTKLDCAHTPERSEYCPVGNPQPSTFDFMLSKRIDLSGDLNLALRIIWEIALPTDIERPKRRRKSSVWPNEKIVISLCCPVGNGFQEEAMSLNPRNYP
ncbi:hypothetical protein KUV57_12525 [Epibacterium sp. DP7N7-1]|nr:hypothetical protein [Epibacterium sp. DP7N7-1]